MIFEERRVLSVEESIERRGRRVWFVLWRLENWSKSRKFGGGCSPVLSGTSVVRNVQATRMQGVPRTT